MGGDHGAKGIPSLINEKTAAQASATPASWQKWCMRGCCPWKYGKLTLRSHCCVTL